MYGNGSHVQNIGNVNENSFQNLRNGNENISSQTGAGMGNKLGKRIPENLISMHSGNTSKVLDQGSPPQMIS